MSTYKEIFGKTIKHLSSDPDNSTYEGQIWYNTTEGKFKTVVAVGAWSSAAPLITARHGLGGTGTQTSAVTMGGNPPSLTVTEEYNGSGWSSGGAMGTARYTMAAAGTQTAALAAFGFAPPHTAASEEYNGTSWTAGNSGNTARYNLGSGGTQTAALAFGGRNSTADQNATEEYDGTTWTSGNNMGTARYQLSGQNVGTQTSSLVSGGFRNPPNANTNLVEEYDGTNWSAGTALPSNQGNTTVCGLQTAAILASGGVAPTTAVKQYDGTTWSNLPSLATQHTQGAGQGSTTASMIQGGNAPGVTTATEEFNFTANTITAAAWASSGSMNTSRFGVTGFGTQTSSIAANGDTFPPTTSRYTAVAEEYNGATWTNITSTGSGTAFATASNLSPGSAGSVYGGEPVSARHEYWDGSSWSEQTDMNAPRYSGAGAGTQTASIMMGGIPGVPANTATEEWNGTSWANQNDAPHGIYSAAASGTQTAAIVFGGNNPVVATTAEYDGTNWTTGGDLLTARAQLGGSGTQTNALAFGGANPPTTGLNATEGYDGTSWSTRPTLGTARRQVGSSGHVSSASLIFGGDSGAKTGATEEFTGETTAINIESVDNS